MGAYQVGFSSHANRDLKQIVRYVSRDDPEAAQRLALRLIDRAFSLAETPLPRMGSRVANRHEMHRLVEGNYIIFYRVFAERGKIRILRFWHSAQNPRRLRFGK